MNYNISDELKDGRSMKARKAVAEAIVSDEDGAGLTQNVYSTDHEDYHVEEAIWHEGEQTHKLTTVREDGNEAYILEETNNGLETEQSVYTRDEAVYSQSIEDPEDFNRFLESLEDGDSIEVEKALENQYAAAGGIGR